MTGKPASLILPQSRAKQLHQLLMGEEGHLIQRFLALQEAKTCTEHPFLMAVLEAQEDLLLSLMQVYLPEIVDQSAAEPSGWIYPIKEHHEKLWKVFATRPSSRIFRHLEKLKQRSAMPV